MFNIYMSTVYILLSTKFGCLNVQGALLSSQLDCCFRYFAFFVILYATTSHNFMAIII